MIFSIVLGTIQMKQNYNYKEIVAISISSILIFLISDKVCHLFSKIATTYMLKNEVDSSFTFLAVLILILILSILFFIYLFTFFIKKGNNKSP